MEAPGGDEIPYNGAPHLAGKKFVFTGELSSMPRAEAEKLAESLGAKTSGSVSKKTDVVVAGQNAGGKYVKGMARGVEIWDEATFLERIKEGAPARLPEEAPDAPPDHASDDKSDLS
jgi:DNA ligase (NAD+)